MVLLRARGPTRWVEEIKKVTDKEIYLAVQTVIKSHGDGAALHAAQRADELMAEGDMEGRRVWHRMACLIAFFEPVGAISVSSVVE